MTCSAWCEGDTHTILEYVTSIEVARGDVGRFGVAKPGPLYGCIAPGSITQLLAVEPASEAAPTPNARYPFAVLVTMRLVEGVKP